MTQIDNIIENLDLEHKEHISTLISGVAEILSYLQDNEKYITKFSVSVELDKDGDNNRLGAAPPFDFELGGEVLSQSIKGLKYHLINRLKELETSYFIKK